MMLLSPRWALALALSLQLAAIPHAGPQQEGPYTFMLLRDADTVAVESVTRTPTTLRAELTADGQGTIRHTTALAPDGVAIRTELHVYPPGMPLDQPTSIHGYVVFREDSTLTPIVPGDSLFAAHFDDLPNALPYLNRSLALVEQVVRRARKLEGDLVEVPLFIIPGAQPGYASVRKFGTDSAAVFLGRVELRLRTDREGSVLGGSVQGLRIVRQHLAP